MTTMMVTGKKRGLKLVHAWKLLSGVAVLLLLGSALLRPASVRAQTSTPVPASGCAVDYFSDGSVAWNNVVWGSGGGQVTASGGVLQLTHTNRSGSIGSRDDDGHYYYYPSPIAGDFDLRVQVISLDENSSSRYYPRAGLMVRESTADDSDAAWVVGMTGTDYDPGAIQVGKRDNAGYSTNPVPPYYDVYMQPPPNYWLRMRRMADEIYGFYSSTGSDWVPVGDRPITLDDTSLILGLFMGGDGANADTVQFDNVQFCWGGASPPPTPTPIPGSGEADLWVRNEDAPDPVSVGGTLIYNVFAINDGPNVAAETQVVNVLPPGVTFVSATPEQGTCAESGGVVTCDLGTVNVGAFGSVMIEIEVRVDAGTTGLITNRASASSLTADPDTSNNTATAQTLVAAVNCTALALGNVEFLDPAGQDGGRLSVHVSGAVADIKITSVDITWDYMQGLDETNVHKDVYLWGVYVDPDNTGFDGGGYLAQDLNDADSPSTASAVPQTLPGSGGNILLDFDAGVGTLGRLDDPSVWIDLQGTDFGFTVNFENDLCPPLSRPAAGGRVPPTPTPTPTMAPPTPTPTPLPSSASYGTFDDFELCPPGTDDGASSVRPKPPGLKDCTSVLSASDMEPDNTMSYWVENDDLAEASGVVRSYGPSCDIYGRTGLFAGTYSLLIRCDRDSGWPYPPYHPWTYHPFVVPGFVESAADLDLDMTVSFYYMIPKAHPPAGIGGSVGRKEDQLRLGVRDVAKSTMLVEPVVVSQDIAFDRRGIFMPVKVELADDFSLENYANRELAVYLDAPNPRDEGDTEFYVDQIKCDICATVKEPPEEPGKVYKVGG
ncbi:MAG: DUF11 domain-containing protein, partial [Anaerolineae bacterium]|nr:DUF11 domain-containing protein [Anaerolineae bacterium]